MDGQIWIFIVVAIVIIVAGIFSSIAAKKRREAMAVLAAKLGLNFTTTHDTIIATRFGFLDRLGKGDNRYAYNILSGNYRGNDVLAFDYHYQTYSTDSKGRRQTHHHHFSCFICNLPMEFPEVTIGKESIFSKIAQGFGYDDIDFESAEFSEKFCVRSKDKKFAYDVCNAQMIEYLLANPDLNIEIEGTALALGFGSCLAASEIESNLERLVKIRSLLPNYLFKKA
ncbi:MAG: hypothetical protein ABIR24_10120 [Verrucomicrobiota bacterium]